MSFVLGLIIGLAIPYIIVPEVRQVVYTFINRFRQ